MEDDKKIKIVSDKKAEFEADILTVGGSGAIIVPARVFRETRIKRKDRVKVTIELTEA